MNWGLPILIRFFSLVPPPPFLMELLRRVSYGHLNTNPGVSITFSVCSAAKPGAGGGCPCGCGDTADRRHLSRGGLWLLPNPGTGLAADTGRHSGLQLILHSVHRSLDIIATALTALFSTHFQKFFRHFCNNSILRIVLVSGVWGPPVSSALIN